MLQSGLGDDSSGEFEILSFQLCNFICSLQSRSLALRTFRPCDVGLQVARCAVCRSQNYDVALAQSFPRSDNARIRATVFSHGLPQTGRQRSKSTERVDNKFGLVWQEVR